MINRSISVVTTQMQLINSIEANNQLKIKEKWLLIGSLNCLRNRQIIEYCNNNDLKSFYTHIINLQIIHSDKRAFFLFNSLYTWVVIVLISKLITFSDVIIGHYLDAIHRFVARLNYKSNIILVDDGVGVFLFSRKRKEEFETKRNLCVYHKLFKMLFYNADFTKFFTKEMIYFTIYSIDCKIEQDKIVKNEYVYLKNHFQDSGTPYLPNSLVLIGEPLVKEHVLTKVKYVQYVSDIINIAKQKYFVRHLIYCPHPGESDMRLIEEIDPEIMIIRNRIPIELTSLSMPSSCLVVSFCSSALWGFKYLDLKVTLRYMPINVEDMSCSKSEIEDFHDIYNKFELIGIMPL